GDDIAIDVGITRVIDVNAGNQRIGADGGGAVAVRADVVALHQISGGAGGAEVVEAADVDPLVEIARHHVACLGRGAADGVIGGVEDVHAVAVRDGEGAGGIGADIVS